MKAGVPGSYGFRGAQLHLLGLPGTAADLWNQKVDAEGCILVFQIGFELRDLFPEHIWGIADATDDTKAASIGNSRRESRACGNVHASEHDGVVDFEEVSDRGPELFYMVMGCQTTSSGNKTGFRKPYVGKPL